MEPSCSHNPLNGGTPDQWLRHILTLPGHIQWQPVHDCWAAVCYSSARSESKGFIHTGNSPLGDPSGRHVTPGGTWKDSHPNLFLSKFRTLPSELALLRLRDCHHFSLSYLLATILCQPLCYPPEPNFNKIYICPSGAYDLVHYILITLKWAKQYCSFKIKLYLFGCVGSCSARHLELWHVGFRALRLSGHGVQA